MAMFSTIKLHQLYVDKIHNATVYICHPGNNRFRKKTRTTASDIPLLHESRLAQGQSWSIKITCHYNVTFLNYTEFVIQNKTKTFQYLNLYIKHDTENPYDRNIY